MMILTVPDATIIGLCSTIAGYFVWLNKKIVDSYFDDQKKTNESLGEISLSLKATVTALADHSDRCLAGQERACAVMATISKALEEHRQHVAVEHAEVAHAVKLEVDEIHAVKLLAQAVKAGKLQAGNLHVEK